MSETYSRLGYMALKKETTENTSVIPNVFIPINDESIAVDYSYSPAVPISASAAVNRRAIKNRIPAPAGVININVEPKTIGYFLEAIFGDLTSGNYIDISTVVGTGFVAGETITGGTSAKTATVAYAWDSFLIITGPSGAFTNGETITGGTSLTTATLGTYDSTVYGHAANVPAALQNTFTVEFGYDDRAIRYSGCKFHSVDAFGQSDNIVTAGIQMMARSAFRHAKVLAVTSSGAGSKTISVDQTKGLVATDTVKLYRPGTGFLDFASASVLTHSIDSIVADTSITVTNLQTSTAVGDLIVLAPQTATYVIDEEFPWSGGAIAGIGADYDTISSLPLEDFSLTVVNELEERHAVLGTNIANRFPTALLQKGLTANGNLKFYNQNENYIAAARLNTAKAISVELTGSQIGSTGVYNQLKIMYPEIQLDAYQLSLAQDNIVDEDIPFSAFYNTDYAFLAQILLVNGVASY